MSNVLRHNRAIDNTSQEALAASAAFPFLHGSGTLIQRSREKAAANRQIPIQVVSSLSEINQL